MTLRSFTIDHAAAAIGFLAVLIFPSAAFSSTILGSSEGFSVLGASSINNTGSTTINGDIGLSPGSSITGAGSISLTGATHNGDTAARQAQADATSAYDILMGLTATSNLTGQNLGGLTLTPGVYKFDSSALLTGALTLDFAGTTNATFVFQVVSSFTTASAASVVVENGNSTDSVFFQVGSSATLGSGTSFSGNLLAMDSISLNSSAKILCGRAMALSGSVTMIGNAISNNCYGAGGEGSGISDFNSNGFSGGTFVSAGYTGGGFNGTPPANAASVSEPCALALYGLGLAGIAASAQYRRRIAEADRRSRVQNAC